MQLRFAFVFGGEGGRGAGAKLQQPTRIGVPTPRVAIFSPVVIPETKKKERNEIEHITRKTR